MINLMTVEDRGRLRRDYRRRLFVFGASLFFFVGLMILTVLVSFYLFLRWQSESLIADDLNRSAAFGNSVGQTTPSDAETAQQAEDLEAWAVWAQRLQSGPEPVDRAWQVIGRLSVDRPAALYLSRLTWQPAESADAAPVLQVAGRAATRGDLLKFVEQLESDPTFARVESPISNLIKERDLDFTLELVVNASMR